MGNRVQAVQQRRQSNAAGPHPKRTLQRLEDLEAMREEHAANGGFDHDEEYSCPCGQPDSAHCNQCGRCPGTSHDEACGW